ncbi:ferredoxin [Streptomyces iranensis]|uniref:ferredoxin n=1 Tax=Streptomyces iranensis TaxID=576784 RepID=UPI0039B74EB7
MAFARPRAGEGLIPNAMDELLRYIAIGLRQTLARVLAAPELFDQRAEDGAVVPLGPNPPLALRDSVAEASFLCPAAAIAVED